MCSPNLVGGFHGGQFITLTKYLRIFFDLKWCPRRRNMLQLKTNPAASKTTSSDFPLNTEFDVYIFNLP